MGTILGGLNLGNLTGGTDDKGETASVDFSFGNVMRCMCFTREDPLEPKKQLVKISESLEKVSERLSKIESVSVKDIGRRRSSMKSRRSMGSLQEEGSPVEEDFEEEEDVVESFNAKVEVEDPASKRNDETSPYWIEDSRLKLGRVDYLSGGEINFWKEMIKKYLQPLEMTEQEKRSQKRGLEEYRDVIIFTFLFTNALYIVGVTMLQTKSEIFINWTMFEDWFGWDAGGLDGLQHNVTFIKPETESLKATIQITRTHEQLDMIGLFFLVTFFSITAIQMVGMFMHRIQTLCHYISTTSLDFFGPKKGKSFNDEINKAGLHVAKQLQNPQKVKTEEEERKEFLKGRRATIADLNKYHKKVKGGGETINLEKEFVSKYNNLDLSSQDDPVMRGLSVRRDTLHALKARRESMAPGHRKNMSVSFGKPKTSTSTIGTASHWKSQDGDSDFAEEDFSEFSGSYRGSGRNSYQFDYDTSHNNNYSSDM